MPNSSRLQRLVTGTVLLAMLLGQGAASAQGSPLDQLLAYTSDKPTEVKAVGTERKAGVRIDDITFASVAGGDPIQAYVVRPESGAGPGFVALYMAAPGTKRIATYPSDHPMNADIIRVDRSTWLAEQLGLPAS